jgi:hypothetical protein
MSEGFQRYCPGCLRFGGRLAGQDQLFCADQAGDEPEKKNSGIRFQAHDGNAIDPQTLVYAGHASQATRTRRKYQSGLQPARSTTATPSDAEVREAIAEPRNCHKKAQKNIVILLLRCAFASLEGSFAIGSRLAIFPPNPWGRLPNGFDEVILIFSSLRVLEGTAGDVLGI